MNKKIANSIIILFLILLGGAYFMKDNSLCNNTQKMQENALAYVEKKYNMKFNIIGIESILEYY